MFVTCSIKFDCSAIANEKMALASNLNDLGKMRFFLLEVLDEIRSQWYENAPLKVQKKGQNFHNKIKSFTERLLNFENRFYVGKNVFWFATGQFCTLCHLYVSHVLCNTFFLYLKSLRNITCDRMQDVSNIQYIPQNLSTSLMGYFLIYNLSIKPTMLMLILAI